MQTINRKYSGFSPFFFLLKEANSHSTLKDTGSPAWLKIALLVVLLLAFLSEQLLATTIEVSKKGPVTSLKAAIKLANRHDTLIIREGVYTESGILISKPLSIIGKNNPIIDGAFKGEVFTIEANGVRIEGLTIRNVEVTTLKDNAAIRVLRSSHCIVRNNKIENAFFGIYLEKADSSLVENNHVSGKAVMESTSGNAIHLWHCHTIDVKNNQVSGHRDGIYFEFVSGSRISGNTSTNNLRYGLHFMFSNGNEYHKNHFIKNGSGVAVMYSKEIVMKENTFENNWGAAAYGILLKDITDSHIEKNRFIQNTVGIHAEGTNRTLMNHNEFRQNGWALRMMGSCEDVRFENNNFIANTFEVATSNNYTSETVFAGNYWSSYTGYDLNKDGIGDVAHKPVKLFSYLMEDVPTSMVLIRSLFIDLLELAEKVAPVLTPTNVQDTLPSIHLNHW